MKKRLIRGSSLFLALLLAVSLLPNLAPTALAAESSGSIGTVSDETLRQLGFDTDSTKIKEILDKDVTPLGRHAFSVVTMSDLMVLRSEFDGWPYTNKTETVYENFKVDNDSVTSLTDNASFLSERDFLPDSDMIRSVAFDPQGIGRQNWVAKLYGFVTDSFTSGAYTDIRLEILKPSSAGKYPYYTGHTTICTLPFQVYPTQAGDFLSVSAGDYDNDGKEELAVYFPWESKYPKVRLYRVSDNGSITLAREINVEDTLHAADNNFNCNGLRTVDVNDPDWENKRSFLAVSMATVSHDNPDKADDLIIAASRPLFGDELSGQKYYPFDAVTRVISWVDPLTNSKTQVHPMRWRWHEYAETFPSGEPARDYAEMMMFGGVGAGEVTGDSNQDVVIAGYRLDEANWDDVDWDLSEEHYLVTYMSYDPKTNAYTQPRRGQRLAYNGDAYKEAINLEDDLDSDDTRWDTFHGTLPVTCFAERGTGFADSVFAGGIVVDFSGGDTVFMLEDEEDEMHTAKVPNSFMARYAAPLKKLRNSSSGDNTLMEAVAGNFNSNPLGREQLAFTYLTTRDYQEESNTFLCMLGLTGPAEDTVGNVNETELLNARFLYNRYADGTELAALSVCAPDVVGKSKLMRYDPSQKPEFYFADPNIVAVMQAAPYFKELGYGAGSTSITQTKGSSEDEEHNVSISAGITIGVEQEASLGIKLFEFSALAKFEANVGYQNATQTTSSASLTFAGGPEHTVALSMVPYIRYYYDEWSPTKKNWEPTCVDVPQRPQITQMTTRYYDDVVSKHNKTDPQHPWESIGGKLINATAGDPSTYMNGLQDEETWVGGQAVGVPGVDTDGYIRVGSAGGSITQTLEESKSKTHGVTWGASYSHEYQANVLGAVAGASFGASYTGGYSWTSFSGQAFRGEVADLPEEYIGDYSFQWLFGTWGGQIDGKNCIVLGYKVKDVHALPKAPVNLHVSDIQSRSVTLNWSSPGPAPEYYILYRHQNHTYYSLATVMGKDAVGGQYTLTDTNCLPDTTYEYAIAAFAPVGNILRQGPYSNIADAHTPPETGVPLINRQPRDFSVRAGGDALFDVSATGAPGATGRLEYQWQEYTGGGWKDLPGSSASTESLTLSRVTQDRDGTMVRCVLSQMVVDRVNTIYSKTAVLHVSLGQTETALTLSRTTGRVDTDAVTLNAHVEERTTLTPLAPTGNVTFTIENTGTSKRVTHTATPDASGNVSWTWTATSPGNYAITAAYNGDTYLTPSVSESRTYFAYVVGTFLTLAGPANMTYGDSADLLPMAYTTDASNNTTSSPAAPVTYVVTRDGEAVTPTDVLTGNIFAPNRSGNYTITASYTDGGQTYTATKSIFVQAKQLKVQALDQTVGLNELPGFTLTVTPQTLSVDGLVGTDKADGLFALRPSTPINQMGVGDYRLFPEYDSSAPQADRSRFSQKYTPSFIEGMLSVTTTRHAVNFTAGVNGDVTARIRDSAPLSSGNTVAEGSDVIFAAVPDNGYTVDTWTVTMGSGAPETVTGDLFVTKKVTGPVTAHVTFKAQTYTLTYSAGPGGTLTAQYDDALGHVIDSGSIVAAQSDILMTAAPDADQMVKQWTVNSVPVKNPDGSLYVQNTYRIERLNESATVQVEFMPVAYYTVTAKAIDADGNPLNAALGQVTDNALRENDGTVKGGAAFTFTTTRAASYQIKEWRKYDTTGNYVVLQGNMKEFAVTSLQENLDIRVVFTTVQSFKLTFSADGGGQVSAKSDSGALFSGQHYAAFIPITFTAVPNMHFVLDHWTVNGQTVMTQEGAVLTDTEYAHPSLVRDTEVKAVFAEKPKITVAANGNGTVTFYPVLLDSHVEFGSTNTLRFAPDPGYEVVALTLDGADVLATALFEDGTGNATDVRTYVLANIQTDHQFQVTFGPIVPKVTATYKIYDLNGSDAGGFNGSLSATSVRKGMSVYDRTGPTVTDAEGSITDLYRDAVTTFTATPDEGYRVTRWEVNGATVMGNLANTLVMPVSPTSGDYTVVVYFGLIGEPVTFGVVNNLGGTISAHSSATDSNFNSGNMPSRDTTLTFTAVPADGYEVEFWYLNGAVVPGHTALTYTYDFKIADGHGADIQVQFARVPFKVTFGGDHGTVYAASGGQNILTGGTVRGDSSVEFTAQADPGYALTGWLVDGAPHTGTPNPLTLVITKDTVVKAVFEPDANCPITFEVEGNKGGTLTAAFGGNSFASGTLAAAGDRILFAATPWQETTTGGDGYEYQVKHWTRDGNPVPNVTGNAFTLTVNNTHHVTVAFERAFYIVDFAAVGSGRVTAAANGVSLTTGDKVRAHSAVNFTATPDAGQLVSRWESAGAAVPGSEEALAHVIASLDADADITAIFAAIPTHIVTVATAGPGAGLVTAKVNGTSTTVTGGQLTVTHHDRVELTAAPRDRYNFFAGWDVTPVTVAHTVQAAVLTLSDVVSDTTATAEFVPQELVIVSAMAGPNGTVTAKAGYGDQLQQLNLVNNAIAIVTGQKVEFTAVPAPGYMADVWTLNGIDQTEMGNVYTIDPLLSTAYVYVTFRQESVFNLPADGAQYTITDIVKSPVTPGTPRQIREGGTVTFTVSPASGYYLDAVSVLGIDCLTETGSPAGTKENILSVDKVDAGGVTVTVKNVTADIAAVVAVSEGTVINVTPPANGTITLKTAAGQDIQSGRAVKRGTVFTATATGLSGYTLDAWGDDAVGKNGSVISLSAAGDRMLISATFKSTGSSSGGETIEPSRPPVADPRPVLTEDHIQYLFGFHDGTVRPDADISRAQVAAVFFRLIKDTRKSEARISAFTDLTDKSAWFYQAVAYLEYYDILSGYPDGTFRPEDPITRAEFAKLAASFTSPVTSATVTFPDVETTHWARPDIATCVAKQWVVGFDDGTFRPQNNISRAQVVTLMNRMLNRKLKPEDIPDSAPRYPDLPQAHWAYADIIEASATHDFQRKPDGFETWK